MQETKKVPVLICTPYDCFFELPSLYARNYILSYIRRFNSFKIFIVLVIYAFCFTFFIFDLTQSRPNT